MNLKNKQITIGELLANPQAKRIAQREFPQLMRNPFVISMARGMTLQQALGYAGNLYREQIDRILAELERI